MRDAILRLLGIDPARIPPDATTQPDWANAHWLESWGAFVFVAVVVAVIWVVFLIYRKEIDTCPKPVRILLAFIRAAVLLLLAAVLLGPVLSFKTTKRIPPTILVLIDESASMGEADKYTGDGAVTLVSKALGQSVDDVRNQEPTRQELVRQLLERDDHAFIQKLRAKGHVKIITFANTLHNSRTFASLISTSTGTVPKAEANVEQSTERKYLQYGLIGAFGLCLVVMVCLFVVGRMQWALVFGLGAFVTVVALGWMAVTSGQAPKEKPAVVIGDEPTDPPDDPNGDPASVASDGQDKKIKIELPDYNAIGQGTNLAKAIREALKDTSGGPVAAIILITDGQHTALHDSVRAATIGAKDQEIPIFTIGIGDTVKSHDLMVTKIYPDDPVWRGDPVRIKASIEYRGSESTAVFAELLMVQVKDGQITADAGTLIERKPVNLRVPVNLQEESASGESGQPITMATVEFEYTPEQAGQYKFTVRVATMPNEKLDDNNQRDMVIKVHDDQARVLLISGSPTWEYRFLQALLRRDKTVDVSCWLQSMDIDMPQEGNTIIKRLPDREDELFQYDLVIMLDPDPSEFNEAWIEALRTFLDKHAGGLIFQAGPKFSGRFLTGAATRGMREILPVSFSDLTSMEVRSLLKPHSRPWPLETINSNLDQSIMQFHSSARANQDRWSRMPPIYWSFPAARAKPTARVLLEHSDPTLRVGNDRRPMLAIGRYGPGQSVYLGFNSTWRWRRLGREGEYYNRFWLQTVRSLIDGRLLKGKRRGSIETGGTEFYLGDRIKIKAFLNDRAYRPLEAKTVPIVVKGPDGTSKRLELKANDDKPGEYVMTLAAAQVGTNELSIELPSDKPDQPVIIVKRFEVRVPDVERRQTWLNKPLLMDIAANSDGKYFEINELDLVPASILRLPDEISVRGKPIELWDTDRLLMLLVILLTIEWALRKRYKLL